MIGRNRREHKNSNKKNAFAADSKEHDHLSIAIPNATSSSRISGNNDGGNTASLQQRFSILSPLKKKKAPLSTSASPFSTLAPREDKDEDAETASNMENYDASRAGAYSNYQTVNRGENEEEDPMLQKPQRRSSTPSAAGSSGSLYPSLESVEGLSARPLYPKLDDDDNDDHHKKISADRVLGQSSNHHQLARSFDPTGGGTSWMAQLNGPHKHTRAASDAMVPTYSSSSRTTKTNNNNIRNVIRNKDRNQVNSSQPLAIPRRITPLSSTATSSLPPAVVSGSSVGINMHPSSSHSHDSGGSAAHERNTSHGQVFGRPSKRNASLEDDTPGPPLQPQNPQTTNSSASSSTTAISGDGSSQSKWDQMNAVVAAVTSSSSSSTFSLPSSSSSANVLPISGLAYAAINSPQNSTMRSNQVNSNMPNMHQNSALLSGPGGNNSSSGNVAAAAIMESSDSQSRGIINDDSDVKEESDTNDVDDDDQNDTDSDDSELRLALLESSKIAEQQSGTISNSEGSDSVGVVGTVDDGDARNPLNHNGENWSADRRESTKSNATTLRTVCDQSEVDSEVIDFCLQQCEEDHATLRMVIQSQAARALDEASLDELNDLLQLNETLLSVIEMAKDKKNQQNAHERQGSSVFDKKSDDGASLEASVNSNNPQKTSLTQASSSMEVGKLVENRDIFTLICMLRSQLVEQRLEAALALLEFARRGNPNIDGNRAHGNSSGKDSMSRSVCDDIHSSGGLHSLLSLFLKSTAASVKLVSALAVAHILPASVVAMANAHSMIKPQVGLKIMECLRFLNTVQEREQRIQNVIITSRECWNAAIMGLSTFWIHALEPLARASTMQLSNNSNSKGRIVFRDHENEDTPPTSLPPRINSSGSHSLGRHRHSRSQTGGFFNQRREQSMAGVQEILEMAVTLVIRFATKETTSIDVDTAGIVLLVEQVCGMEAARPIAVREGILRVLVDWIRSKDREQNGIKARMQPAAVLSLRHLTSINDKYMAGWIHSQMVSSGALPAIVALTRDIHLTYPVRLAICQILASLCIAPHTRAAVVEADCIHFLIDLLSSLDFNDTVANDELALSAGQALLQLATGAMQRAGGLGNGYDNELIGFASRERHDRILNDIVARGAIASFVSIALKKQGKLRIIAIETLGVLSEDVSPSRGTRLQLCEDGAARALGKTLMDCLVRVPSQDSRGQKNSIDNYLFEKDLRIFTDEEVEQLYHALCALSNILDPTMEGTLSRTTSSLDVTEGLRPRSLLARSCRQTIESGGLESMLRLAKFPLLETKVVELVEEACHSLSLLSPFLLSKDITSKGLVGWAGQVLDVFCHIVNKLEQHNSGGESDDRFGDNMDLHVSVLQGIGALAKSAPLKVRIIDRVLPYVIRAKNSRDHMHVSNSASQVFQSLEFADDEVAVQTAGNNANLLADWFCLQRQFLIQAMARAEIRQYLLETWGEAVAKANHNDHTTTSTPTTKLARMISGGSRGSNASSSVGSESVLAQVGGAGDVSFEKSVRAVIREYQDMFGDQAAGGSGIETQRPLQSAHADEILPKGGLLSQQVYPLSTSQSEALWILKHANVVAEDSAQNHKSLSSHVEKLLERCFPSRLLREHVMPTQVINIESSYKFRTILMPQRRYFSFRREGLLLSRLCDKESAATSCPSEVYWSLNFTNSSFAGEFPESLVQALYLCPTICALSFVGNSRKPDDSEEKDEKLGEVKSASMHGDGPEGGGLLANLVGSLPPWVANLTFERVLDDQGMKALVAILETLGRLTAGQGLTRQSFSKKSLPGQRRLVVSLDVQAQGRFSAFAVRFSPDLSTFAWRSFFGLMGQANPTPRRHVEERPLSTLRCLDISNNGLGDELCAMILGIIHTKKSGCRIEELDLSGNGIMEGKHVLRVLTGYAQTYRVHRLSGVQVQATSWKAPLRILHLSSNGLSRGKAWLEIIALLKHNTLELNVLDFSVNQLFLKEDDYDSDILVSSLMKNSSLRCLDLSGNQFSVATVDDILGQLRQVSSEKGLAIIGFSKNSPPLNEHQERLLESICKASRSVILQRLSAENEAKKAEELELANVHEDESIDDPVEREAPLIQNNTKPSHVVTNPHSAPVADNKITVLFSAPLVFKDGSGNLRPFAKLDFEMERELLWQCLKEASRDIDLSFDSATHDRLLATISKRCGCLHYSGHGNEHYLPFEDGKGGPNWFEVEDIKKLIGVREGGVPFRFVFVSACYSGLAGETFASAGVPHVVCCRQEFELKDAAALAFTRQFYLALADGHTVKESFELGCKAVRATPNLRDAEREMEKFILLPKDGNHDVPIFEAKPVALWPRSLHTGGGISSRALLSKSKMATGSARSVELDVRNMIQEDPSPSPPQFFIGREVDMYIVLNLLLAKRLVSVIGDVGVGRSSLVCALCHYVNERKTTMTQINRIHYVKAKQGRTKQHRVKSLVQRLVKKLIESGTISSEDVDKDADIESLIDLICKALKYEHVLIVFDRTDLLEDDESNEFPMFLSNLFRETRNVRVLLTAKGTLGIPSIGGHVEHYYRLGPLTYANSVRLFASLCPYMHTPSDRRRLYNKMVANIEEAELLPTDPGISHTVVRKFELIGNGIPSNIEKAAYTISKENFMFLLRSEAQEDAHQKSGSSSQAS
ncbi:hypothetical protein ACA910_002992 [Epithemia clementina (nom. ined.)]